MIFVALSSSSVSTLPLRVQSIPISAASTASSSMRSAASARSLNSDSVMLDWQR